MRRIPIARTHSAQGEWFGEPWQMLVARQTRPPPRNVSNTIIAPQPIIDAFRLWQSTLAPTTTRN